MLFHTIRGRRGAKPPAFIVNWICHYAKKNRIAAQIQLTIFFLSVAFTRIKKKPARRQASHTPRTLSRETATEARDAETTDATTARSRKPRRPRQPNAPKRTTAGNHAGTTAEPTTEPAEQPDEPRENATTAEQPKPATNSQHAEKQQRDAKDPTTTPKSGQRNGKRATPPANPTTKQKHETQKTPPNKTQARHTRRTTRTAHLSPLRGIRQTQGRRRRPRSKTQATPNDLNDTAFAPRFCKRFAATCATSRLAFCRGTRAIMIAPCVCLTSYRGTAIPAAVPAPTPRREARRMLESRFA